MSNNARNGAGCAVAAGDELAVPQALVLSIGAVARMFKVSTFTLRYYEWHGLIRRRRAGRERVYSWFDCERIALLVKAHKAGLALGLLAPVIKAMDDRAPRPVADAGRRKCLTLIHALEDHQRRIGDVLGELYRIDWELADRLGAKDRLGNDPRAERD